MYRQYTNRIPHRAENLERETMEELLQKAALEGNTEQLRQLNEQNPLLLDTVIASCRFDGTPLHTAALLGHLDFVTELVNLKPDLAEAQDSRGSSPLHLASAKGYVDIAAALIAARPEMCSALDRDGLNPIHVAAIKGKVEVLKKLLRARPEAARAVVDQGETALHLCVKYWQIGALKLLMEQIDEGHLRHLVNAKDVYGYTILHLAVADKQIETVKYLLTSDKIDVNAQNANGHTALDVLAQSRRAVQDYDISNALREAGASKASDLSSSFGNGNNEIATPVPTNGNGNNEIITPLPTNGTNLQIPSFEIVTPLPTNGTNPQIPSFLRASTTTTTQEPAQGDNNPRDNRNQDERLAKKRDALMVVASLLASMAFQAGVNPPGGVWQDNKDLDRFGIPIMPNGHRAGEAVVAYNYPQSYKYYLRANTISFVASLSTILLLISGLPFRRRTFMRIMMVIMWLSITSMAFTYSYCIVAVTPKTNRGPLRRTMYVAVPVWCGVMGLLLLGHTLRLTGKWMKGKGIDMWEPVKKLC